MMNKAFIEVIVAHYNGSQYITEQLDSIEKSLLPAGTELKIKVIDDASSKDEFDKLLVTCSRWSNIEVLRNDQNLGVIRTFEKGLKLSRANYVMLSDQDDVWLPNKIQVSLTKMQKTEDDGAALVFTDVRTVDINLETITERMLNRETFDSESEKHRLLFQNQVAGCTIMVNRKLLDVALPFPTVLPMHDHWLVICAAFAGKIGFVNEVTMLYRQHSANLVGQPQRQLSARLKRPFVTVKQFNRGLAQKAAQTNELSKRLPVGVDSVFLSQVALAFQTRTLKGLNFLIRSHVFDVKGLSLPLICALYLISGGS